MKHETIERIISQADGHLIIRYWTPREYADKFPFSEKKLHNEDVDRLNQQLYAKAIQQSKDPSDVKVPHCYGVLQT